MPSSSFELRARLIAGSVLLGLGAWILHSFLPLMAWSIVLAVSTWPIYQWLLSTQQFKGKTTLSSIILIVLIGAIIIAPLSYGMTRLLHEAQSLIHLITESPQGIDPPLWLGQFPIVGSWLIEQWKNTLGSSEAITLEWLRHSDVMHYTQYFAGQLLHRFIGFLTTLLLLFFVYHHGAQLARHALASSERLFGSLGMRYLRHAAIAVRATVNGMVIIGLLKGLLLGLAYALAGLSHPAILGAATGLLAMIPYAAKLIISACALVLLAQGHPVIALSLFAYGMVLTLLADNYVRPLLIGSAVRLPFIWTLLGIFGGMETLGLLGLFLGPTLMAVLMSIWRDWLETVNEKNTIV